MGGSALAFLIQLVPYGHDRTNPSVVQEPEWDSARTRELFFAACQDCHSNETAWPWYGAIAPVSWLVRWDVDEGRSHFNVSEWGRTKNQGDEAAEMVQEGEMPLWYYLPAHPEARLTAAEKAELIAGLERTFPADDERGHGEHED
jgi:mono/diheme cytochrome c family protein